MALVFFLHHPQSDFFHLGSWAIFSFHVASVIGHLTSREISAAPLNQGAQRTPLYSNASSPCAVITAPLFASEAPEA
jgi:hypothetical protein